MGGGGGAGGGAGYGRMSVQQVCDATDVALDEALTRLKAAGIDANGSDVLRSLAERAGKSPHDLYTVIAGQ